MPNETTLRATTKENFDKFSFSIANEFHSSFKKNILKRSKTNPELKIKCINNIFNDFSNTYDNENINLFKIIQRPRSKAYIIDKNNNLKAFKSAKSEIILNDSLK